MALAEDLQVERQHQRRAARGLGAVDQSRSTVAVAHDVELEPEGLRRRLRDVLDRADPHGREAKGTPKASAAWAALISPSAHVSPARPVGATASGILPGLADHGPPGVALRDVPHLLLAQGRRFHVPEVRAKVTC